MRDRQTFAELRAVVNALPKNVLVPSAHIHSLLDETEKLVEHIADLERQLAEATAEIKEVRRAFGHDYSPSEEEDYCKECGLEQYNIVHTNCFDVKKKWMLEARKKQSSLKTIR